jgi:hypothetical protein
MHNRSHVSRNGHDQDAVFFDDMSSTNKNHLQSYHTGLNKQFSQYQNCGPTLQKPSFQRANSKKILSCTNANSISKGFYSKRNSGAGLKAQGAPAKQMTGRFTAKQRSGTR